jgi:transcriptional regulator
VALTEKEVAVLRLRSQGLTQADVAKRLKISQAAVSDFESNAYHKLLDAELMLEEAKDLNVKMPAKYRRGVRR